MQNNPELWSALLEMQGRRDFNKICQTFRMLEGEAFPASLLLLKATAIQLAQDSSGFTLDDARDCLELATALEPRNTQTWLDLGHFQYAVDDNSSAALDSFSKARQSIRDLTQDLLEGEIKANLELGRKATALKIYRSLGPNDITENFGLKLAALLE